MDNKSDLLLFVGFFAFFQQHILWCLEINSFARRKGVAISILVIMTLVLLLIAAVLGECDSFINQVSRKSSITSLIDNNFDRIEIDYLNLLELKLSIFH